MWARTDGDEGWVHGVGKAGGVEELLVSEPPDSHHPHPHAPAAPAQDPTVEAACGRPGMFGYLDRTACQAACDREPRCRAFDVDSGDRCYLLAGAPALVPAADLTPPNPTRTCYRKVEAAPGGCGATMLQEIAGTTVSTVAWLGETEAARDASCCAQCYANPACMFWVRPVSAGSPLCYLRSNPAGQPPAAGAQYPPMVASFRSAYVRQDGM